MGGSTGRGNTTPAAEFNIFVDPEAAAIVFESGLPVTMIGLNLTHQARATRAVLERIQALPGEPARALEGWMSFFGSTYERVHGEFAPPVHDPCTVALLIDPSLMSWSTPSSPSRPRAAGRAGRPWSISTAASAARPTRASRSSSTRPASGTWSWARSSASGASGYLRPVSSLRVTSRRTRAATSWSRTNPAPPRPPSLRRRVAVVEPLRPQVAAERDRRAPGDARARRCCRSACPSAARAGSP